MQIRKVGPDDWQLLREVRLTALLDTPDAFGSTHSQEIQFDEGEWRARIDSIAWFVAIDDGKPVGIVGGGAFSHPARDLISMWASESARGTGVAQHLVAAVVDWARSEGATELLLSVADGNDQALRFYEKIGFVPTGNRKQLRSNPSIGESEMRLDLGIPGLR